MSHRGDVDMSRVSTIDLLAPAIESHAHRAGDHMTAFAGSDDNNCPRFGVRSRIRAAFASPPEPLRTSGKRKGQVTGINTLIAATTLFDENDHH